MKKLFSNFREIFFNRSDILSGEENTSAEIPGGMSESSLVYFERKSSLKNINNIYYFWNYDKDFKKLIFAFKFKNRKYLSKEIAGLIKEGIFFLLKKENVDYIIPVPISSRRESERGFNQTEAILQETGLNYIKMERIKNTKKMFSILDETKRDENIKNSFFISGDYDLNGKSILLFDDIITTGSTLREMKRELEKVYKIRKITVLTLAAAREIKINNGKI